MYEETIHRITQVTNKYVEKWSISLVTSDRDMLVTMRFISIRLAKNTKVIIPSTGKDEELLSDINSERKNGNNGFGE